MPERIASFMIMAIVGYVELFESYYLSIAPHGVRVTRQVDSVEITFAHSDPGRLVISIFMMAMGSGLLWAVMNSIFRKEVLWVVLVSMVLAYVAGLMLFVWGVNDMRGSTCARIYANGVLVISLRGPLGEKRMQFLPDLTRLEVQNEKFEKHYLHLHVEAEQESYSSNGLSDQHALWFAEVLRDWKGRYGSNGRMG